MFSQVCVCSEGRGYPSPRFFHRSLVPGPFRGYPSPGQGWGYPSPSWGYPRIGVPPARTGLGYPLATTGLGYPHGQDRTGVPLPLPGQNSRASTCYAACGMPLAFTWKDFLVVHLKTNRIDRSSINSMFFVHIYVTGTFYKSYLNTQ